jgi:hypothetical protein
MSRATADAKRSFVHQVCLTGRTEGAVKTLAGFRKGRHTVPDAITPAAQAFLARLCTDDLAEEAEACFQATRTALAFKRRDISLELSAPSAVLATRDFTLEWDYAFEEGDPTRWVLTRSLREVKREGLIKTAEFNELFAAWFSAIEFGLGRGLQVEAVIDAVEDLEGKGGLRVHYPSDCRSCTLTVEGVPAKVACDGMTLTMAFERPGSPRELWEAFAGVRAAFALSKNRVLAGLL